MYFFDTLCSLTAGKNELSLGSSSAKLPIASDDLKRDLYDIYYSCFCPWGFFIQVHYTYIKVLYNVPMYTVCESGYLGAFNILISFKS